MGLYDRFKDLHDENPDWCSLDFADAMDCSTSHVRKMAARAGLALRPATVGRRLARNAKSSEHAKKELALAERQCAELINYWAERGYQITAEVQKLPFCVGARCCPATVKTNLVNGLPRGYRAPSRLDRLRKQRGHV